jgi:hypothetical protein
MGWRWRKTFSRGPFGTTVSKRGIGWSWGIPGLRYGVSPSGRRYVTVGIPGTGLSWIKHLGGGSPAPLPPAPPSAPRAGPAPPAVPSGTGAPPPPAPGPWWKQKGLTD